MKILVSACLLGENCKYNGGNNKNEDVIKLGEKHTLIPICPETFSGLPSPRMPSEIKDGKVYSKNGEDLTDFFFDGAEKSLYISFCFLLQRHYKAFIINRLPNRSTERKKSLLWFRQNI